MTRHQPPHAGQKAISNERNSLGKPQLFVQLTFGVSWSDRHIPRTHTLSYTSQHLKNARNSGHFPRQESCHQHHQHRRQDSLQRQHHRGERHNRHHHHHQPRGDHQRDHERPRGRSGNSRPLHPGTLSPPREPRSDSRRAHSERGSSAPPVVHNGPWSDDEEGGPSATLFPRPARTARNPPHIWKDLPTNPARFRLGEDGLPWSASAWPFDADSDEDELPFVNLPTTLPLSPPARPREEDPQRVRELESLSTAMVTVDNGFENQWWNQGPREPTASYAPDSPEDEDDEDANNGDNSDDMRPMSTAEAVLLAAAEPPSAVETYSPNSETFNDLVSPLSDFSPGFNIASTLHRSFSTRPDELWMDR
ncbi:hypothetical protein GGS24DRAFT_465839 [Hypoxylon argillaceum]|nr:hypothetical protein GGS24DRAFT_465839 [Hypoxylon argillaceum]